MYYPLTGWMSFDDTIQLSNQLDIIQPPVIHTSKNGWIYKPDEARTKQEIKRGLNKAWPRERGYQRRDYPREWHAEYMRNGLEQRNWALPRRIEKPTPYQQSSDTNAFTIHWKSQPWGWQNISMNIREPASYGHERNIVVSYTFRTHDAYSWYKDKRVEEPYRGGGNDSNSFKVGDRDEVRNLVRLWLEDPWNELIGHIGIQHAPLLRNFMKPPEMSGVTYLTEDEIDNDAEDGLDFYGTTTGSSMFWSKGKIEQVMTNDIAWSALRRVLKAFEFAGYELSVDTEYSYRDENRPITGFTIGIPEDPNSTKRARKKGHTISINREGISVQCGFVQDEKQWMERETRMAKEHMALLEKDLFTEFSIDMSDDSTDA